MIEASVFESKKKNFIDRWLDPIPEEKKMNFKTGDKTITEC